MTKIEYDILEMNNYERLLHVLIILLFGVGLGALYSSGLENEYKIIIIVFFIMLTLIYGEFLKSNSVGQIRNNTLLVIYMQLNLMGKKQSIKPNTAMDQYKKEEKEIADREKFKTLLGGDSSFFSVIIYFSVVFFIALITVEILK